MNPLALCIGKCIGKSASLAVLCLIVLPGFCALPPVQQDGPPNLEALKKLDASVYRQSKEQAALGTDPSVDKIRHILESSSRASELPRGPLVVPPVYLAYLDKVGKMSEGLLVLKDRFDKQAAQMPLKSDTQPQLVLSLQELGAMTQRLSVDNRRFKSQFDHGESAYQSYQLIEEAVHALEDATNYWRLSNRYRSLYRAEMREKIEDDDLLTLKLQTALNAIESLKTIQNMRDRLKKLDADTYP